MTDIDIFILFVDSGAGGADSLVGGVDDTAERRRKAGAIAEPCALPRYVLVGRLCGDACATLQSSTSWSKLAGDELGFVVAIPLGGTFCLPNTFVCH